MAANDTGERTTVHGQDQQGPTTERPTNPQLGLEFFDLTLAAGNGMPIWWNGTEWVDATGTAV